MTNAFEQRAAAVMTNLSEQATQTALIQTLLDQRVALIQSAKESTADGIAIINSKIDAINTAITQARAALESLVQSESQLTQG
jgi:hypothetical protein